MVGKEEDLRRVSSSAASVEVNYVWCNTEADVLLLHCLLASTPVWRITGHLDMFAGTEESWALLAQVMPRGRVGWVRVTEEAVRGARGEHLRGVWGATERGWWNGSTGASIAEKSEGEAGLQKVMEFGKK